jgi:predicted acyl esterase
MRGSGDSDGLMLDEYTAQELQDACDVIAWLGQQPWSTGAGRHDGHLVGWLQRAAGGGPAPEALKAVITLCSTDDRYTDDIHYKGGCLLGENLGWSATMFAYSSRPPDPALVGDRWRRCGWSGWRPSRCWPSLAGAPAPRRLLETRLRQRGHRRHPGRCAGRGRLERRLHQRRAAPGEQLKSPVKGIIGPGHTSTRTSRCPSRASVSAGGAALVGPLPQGHRHRRDQGPRLSHLHHGSAPAGWRRSRTSPGAGWRPRLAGRPACEQRRCT